MFTGSLCLFCLTLPKGRWGTICDDSTNTTRIGDIACNELGYRTCLYPDMGGSGQTGPGITWLDEMDCNANTTHLTDCHHYPWGKHNCNKDENIVIKCANRMALAGVCNYMGKWSGSVRVYFG